MMNVPWIAMAIPCRDEVKAGWNQCFTHLCFWSSRNIRANFAFMEQRGAMISGQRNDIVRRGLKQGMDWFWWCDTDMTFPPNALKRLLDHGKPIVGCTYNKRIEPYETLGHFIDDGARDASTGGLRKADYMPGGFMLVHADVYRKIGYPWYFETYQWEGKSLLDSFMRMIDDWSFVDMPDSVRSAIYSAKGIREWLEENEPPLHVKGRHTMSEDYNFSRKVRRAGYEIFCDLDLTFELGHIGEQVVTCERPPAAIADAAE